MAGTREGNLKARQTLLDKFGSEEAIREWRRSIGAKGGRNGTGHDFAHGRVDPREARRLADSKIREARKEEA